MAIYGNSSNWQGNSRLCANITETVFASSRLLETETDTFAGSTKIQIGTQYNNLCLCTRESLDCRS